MPAVVTDTVRVVIANRGMQRFLYREGDLGLITGEHPDPDRAARVINALLLGPPIGQSAASRLRSRNFPGERLVSAARGMVTKTSGGCPGGGIRCPAKQGGKSAQPFRRASAFFRKRTR